MRSSQRKANLWNRRGSYAYVESFYRAVYSGARILIVDDEPANVRLLERVLQSAGYNNVVSTSDSRAVEALIEAQMPALLLLDLTMPHCDGFAVMAAVKARLGQDDVLPVLF